MKTELTRSRDMRAALVTGGAGFIGAHLSSYLCRNGWSVVVLDNLSEGRESNLAYVGAKVDLLTLDVTEPKAFGELAERPIDTVFHLAAQASVPKSVEQPELDFRTNVVGTLNVLEFVRRRKIRKLVLPSTVSVYAPDSPMPLKETAPIRASSPYGAAKAAAENYCFAYASSYGLDTTVLRLFNVYGPLMSKYVIHDVVRKLQANPKHLKLFGDGSQIRDYLYVDDAVRAFVLAADKGKPGEVYNVGGGVPVPIADLVQQIISLMGLRDVRIEWSGTSWRGDVKRWCADLTKIQKLGFKHPVSLSEGLARTVSFLTEHPGEVPRYDATMTRHNAACPLSKRTFAQTSSLSAVPRPASRPQCKR